MQQANTASARPLIGSKVQVTWKTDGECRLVKCKETDYVKAIYLDGSVLLESGDMYAVKPAQDGKHTWQTVMPKTDKRNNIL